MKKSYLAAAAILGAAVLGGEAHAVKIDLGKTKFKMGFRAKVHAVYDGKDSPTDKSDLSFSVPFTRIYAKGSISKIFKWGWQMEFGRYRQSPEFIDSFIMLDFAKEFRIMAGAFKVPFERHAGIESGWSLLLPQDDTYGIENEADMLFNNPFKDYRVARSGSRSPQVGVWGDVAGGMIRYYAMLVDGLDASSANDPGTGLALRVQFAPTMLGYSNDPGYVLKHTYLGKKNMLVLGVSYATLNNMNSNPRAHGVTGFSCSANPCDMNAWAVDLLWEQNFGTIVPNLQFGFVNTEVENTQATIKRRGFLVSGQVLFNQKTIFGKPAIAFRYTQADPNTNVGNNEASVFGVAAQLYVKGVGNRIALEVDNVNRPPGQRDYTDVTLALWFNF